MASKQKAVLASSAIEQISSKIVLCKKCPELREYCTKIATTRKRAYINETYWGKPVPAFGDSNASVMLVGLAPGAHGSNRTGRAFTGDASGNFLYPALYRAGFASEQRAISRADGLQLRNCIITAAARCAPPQNRPTSSQLANCLPYLVDEFDALPALRVMIGLGRIGFDAIVKVLRAREFDFVERPKFGHAAEYKAVQSGRTVFILGSYHPSQQNTNTGRLTEAMFDSVLQRAVDILENVR